jgi:hypothetical protein
VCVWGGGGGAVESASKSCTHLSALLSDANRLDDCLLLPQLLKLEVGLGLCLLTGQTLSLLARLFRLLPLFGFLRSAGLSVACSLDPRSLLLFLELFNLPLAVANLVVLGVDRGDDVGRHAPTKLPETGLASGVNHPNGRTKTLRKSRELRGEGGRVWVGMEVGREGLDE